MNGLHFLTPVFSLDGSNLEMKLVNNRAQRCLGRVEVKFQGKWGTVCDDNFSKDHASVICKQLGCGSAISFSGSDKFGAGFGPIWLDDLACSGNESALWDCKHGAWGKHNCDHAEDVGVICLEGADLSLRVTDGVSKCSGRLEVKFQGEWGTVCDDDWDSQDASVVCKQLGCPTAITAIGRVNASEGSGPIWLDDIFCNGDESALWECRHREWGKHNCHHREDTGVTCSDGSDLELRLVGGGGRCAGIVEVEIQKLVGKMCSRSWTLKEANVVCRQLGCGSALQTQSIIYSKSKATDTFLSPGTCSGNETSLWQCKNWQWGALSCDHSKEAQVTCSGKTFNSSVKKQLNSKDATAIVSMTYFVCLFCVCFFKYVGEVNLPVFAQLKSSELVHGLVYLEGPCRFDLGMSLAGVVDLCRNLQVSVKQLE
nr:scavenger receptor cysteine-rich type 1 protein M130-like [Peromyscus maniculatus bairdii]